MYIHGLFSSWGDSRICPAWSPSEHQLTPALSLIWGPCPKPRRPEEVVYIPNDSCSHFTQHLFPPKLPWQRTCTIPYYTFNLIHTYYTSHSNKQLLFLLHDKFTLSFLRFFIAGRLPSVSRVRYTILYSAEEAAQQWKRHRGTFLTVMNNLAIVLSHFFSI